MIYTSINEYDSNGDEIFDLDTEDYHPIKHYTDDLILGCKEDNFSVDNILI